MLSFSEEMNHPQNTYKFYTLKCNNKEYVNNLYEAAEKHRKNNLPIYCIFLSLLFGAGIYAYFNYNK